MGCWANESHFEYQGELWQSHQMATLRKNGAHLGESL